MDYFAGLDISIDETHDQHYLISSISYHQMTTATQGVRCRPG
jgi:hypothetical protein